MTALEVAELLKQSYGSRVWSPRYDPLEELIFTILSQHTSDVNAERAFQSLRRTFGSWEGILSASDEAIAAAITSGGLARIKAPRLRAILEALLEKRGSFDLSFLKEMKLEEAKAWLRSLPGVGPKTAACVLCLALGMPALPVDTHVHRVARRLGLIDHRIAAEQAHELLEAMLPPERIYEFHVHLIEHGRSVCKALRPRCEVCPLAQGCPSSLLPQGPPATG